jgi:hypothetical protein
MPSYAFDPEQTDSVNPEIAKRFYDTATNMAIQPGAAPAAAPAPDARWMMSALAAQGRYNSDEGDASAAMWRDPNEIAAARLRGPYNRTQPNSAFGDSYLTTARTSDASPVAYQTAAGPITQADVERGMEAALSVSGGGLKIGKAPAIMPEVGERYPSTVPPVTAIDPVRKKEFLQKSNSPEAEAVQKLRIAAQRDISAGNYDPFFDPKKRFDVDPSRYPAVESTLTQLSKRPGPTNAAAYAAAAGPEAGARLDAAFTRGMQQEAGAGNWYQMGQLEKEFIKEYGPVAGPQQFKSKFADAMAATTGGADPTSNLMMAHYGNYLRATGRALPEKSYDYPFPVGGRYAATNMDQYRKMMMEGAGVTPANPKRYNFAGNFTGNPAGSTIDEQMMGLIEPGGAANPPGGAYGHYEAPVAARAAAAGVDPRFFQEVAWAGAKDAKTKGGYTAQPMIGVVNEAIERTHRITGMPHAEIVRRGLVRSEIPLYGIAGATTMGGLAAQNDYGERER